MKPKYDKHRLVMLRTEQCSIYQVIISFDWSEHTPEQVAEILNCSVNTIYKYISRAKRNGVDVDIGRKTPSEN